MQEKPKVVVSRTRRTESTAKEFTFAESDIRAAGDPVASYRAAAWSAFKKHSLPVTTEEAWRRTLRNSNSLPMARSTIFLQFAKTCSSPSQQINMADKLSSRPVA